ncbi:MAG: NAD(P)-binding domain-containing protein, partial [Pseudomonadota bacterium]
MMGGHRLTLIGAGGLAHSLAHAFVQRSPHQVVQVLSRTGTTAELLVRQLPAARAGDMRQAVHTGVQAVLLCVPDGQIVTLAHALVIEAMRTLSAAEVVADT